MKNLHESLSATLYGIMTWELWDAPCGSLCESRDAWYVYAVGHGLPETPFEGSALHGVLDEIDALLRRDHEENYFGIAYADDLSTPALIKIYDPNDLGAVCGSSGRPIPTAWVLSRQPPQPIYSDMPLPNSRRRWWQSLMARMTGP